MTKRTVKLSQSRLAQSERAKKQMPSKNQKQRGSNRCNGRRVQCKNKKPRGLDRCEPGRVASLKALYFASCFTGKMISMLDEEVNLVVLDQFPLHLSAEVVGKMLGISCQGDMIRGCFAKDENTEVQNNCYHEDNPALLNDDLKRRVEFMHEMAALDSSSSTETWDLLDAIYLELKDHKKMNWAQELIRRSFASWNKAQGKDELLMYERVLRVAILDQLRKCEPTSKLWKTQRGKMQHSIINIELPGKRKKVGSKTATNIALHRSNGDPSTRYLSIALDLCMEPLVEAQQMYHTIKELKLERSKLKDQVTEFRSELKKVKTESENIVEVLRHKCCHYMRLVFLKGQESFELAKRVEELLELEENYSELKRKFEGLNKLVGVSETAGRIKVKVNEIGQKSSDQAIHGESSGI